MFKNKTSRVLLVITAGALVKTFLIKQLFKSRKRY